MDNERDRRNCVEQIRNWPLISSIATGESESDLVLAARRGEPSAMEALFCPYERDLYMLCRGMLGHAQDAEDAAQEALLRAMRTLPSFRGDSSIKTWLLRIGANVCIDWKRKRSYTAAFNSTSSSDAMLESAPANEVLNRMRMLEAL